MLNTNLKQTEKPRITSAAFCHSLLGLSLLVTCTQVFASSETKSEITDSVFAWGMWEYNIAPAAGDLQGRNANPLNPRSAKVTLRTNSNSALDPTTFTPGGTAELSPNIRPIVPPASTPPPIIITQAPPPRVVPIPTIPAPPAATPPTNITPPPAPNIGTSPGAGPISGTPLNLGF